MPALLRKQPLFRMKNSLDRAVQRWFDEEEYKEDGFDFSSAKGLSWQDNWSTIYQKLCHDLSQDSVDSEEIEPQLLALQTHVSHSVMQSEAVVMNSFSSIEF